MEAGLKGERTLTIKYISALFSFHQANIQPPSSLLFTCLYKRDSTLEEHLGVYGLHDWLKSQPSED